MEKPLMEANEKGKAPVWDCGSSLYDSFELKSFERQLDSAISSRTLSMPHLSDNRRSSIKRPPPQPQTQTSSSKKPSKLSRSFQKLIRSFFKSKQSNNPLYQMQNESGDGHGHYVVYYDSSGALTTIPEGPEFDGFSPEIRSLVTRTSSERFTASSVGISCA